MSGRMSLGGRDGEAQQLWCLQGEALEVGLGSMSDSDQGCVQDSTLKPTRA